VLSLADLPWSFLMALVSLSLLFYVYRQRQDIVTATGLTNQEIALLALGSIAGWAVNIPVAILGGTYLAVNLGGALVPLLLIVGWWRRRILPRVWALIVTAAVAFVSWRIVEFRPDTGIIARFPHFFLPVVVAFVLAGLLTLRNPARGVTLAYAGGTVGALIGADLLNIDDIARHFTSAPENTVISIGGAGVFDMVFLAGSVAMTLQLAILSLRPALRPSRAPPARYPGTPVSLRDSARVRHTYQGLFDPNPLEKALAGLALSDLALTRGDHQRALKMSYAAVRALERHDDVRTYLATTPHAERDGERTRLRECYRRHKDEGTPDWRTAGQANTAAKRLVAHLAPHARLQHRLEGVA